MAVIVSWSKSIWPLGMTPLGMLLHVDEDSKRVDPTCNLNPTAWLDDLLCEGMDLTLDLNPTAWFVDLLFEGMDLTFNLNRTTWLVDLLCKGTDPTFNTNQNAWLNYLFWERMDLTFNRNQIAWLVDLLWEGMDPTFNLNPTAWLVDLLCDVDQVVLLLTYFVILTRWSAFPLRGLMLSNRRSMADTMADAPVSRHASRNVPAFSRLVSMSCRHSRLVDSSESWPV